VPVQVVADLNQAPDPKAAILALDSAVKAGALIAEIEWGITRDAAGKRYAVDVRAVRVRNLTTGETLASTQPNQRAAYFVAGKRSKPTAARGTLQVSSSSGVADVYIDGQLTGKTPLSILIAEGNYVVDVRWADIYSKTFKQSSALKPGSSIKIVATTGVYKVGGPGPAGGIIFYDKGKATEGWRFLEAAPSDQSAGIQWYNGDYRDIKGALGTGIGTGKANTAAIIVAQGVGSYAAALCDSLVIGDYDDWFLPSKDELNLMYTNLKKAGLGGFGGVWFWSSSQRYNYVLYNLAWEQNFFDGEHDKYSRYTKFDKFAVRVVRAF